MIGGVKTGVIYFLKKPKKNTQIKKGAVCEHSHKSGGGDK